MTTTRFHMTALYREDGASDRLRTRNGESNSAALGATPAPRNAHRFRVSVERRSGGNGYPSSRDQSVDAVTNQDEPSPNCA